MEDAFIGRFVVKKKYNFDKFMKGIGKRKRTKILIKKLQF